MEDAPEEPEPEAVEEESSSPPELEEDGPGEPELEPEVESALEEPEVGGTIEDPEPELEPEPESDDEGATVLELGSGALELGVISGAPELALPS